MAEGNIDVFICNRKRAALVDLYESTVTDQYYLLRRASGTSRECRYFPFRERVTQYRVWGVPALLPVARYLDYYGDIQGQQPDFLDLRFVVRQPTAFF